MAGIGVKLNHIFEKKSLTSHLIGFGYSTVVTIAPMLVVIGTVMLMSIALGYDTVNYARRGLFSATLLYIFIFALLTSAPFNAVLSRYLSDVIYEERYEDILPCYTVGLVMNILFSCLVGIPFCVREYIVGNINVWFIFIGFCGYISLVLVFYSMLYLSICKDYQKISLFFLLGMVVAFVMSWILVKRYDQDIIVSMLVSLTCGFFLSAVLEAATIRQYFKRNSHRYRPVLSYFKKYWKLIFINWGYVLGLYIHNFVFWTTELKMVVRDCFVMAPAYDMATCLAMFTSLSSTIIFISRVEMYFGERYRAYSTAVTGGRWIDIENAKKRMMSQLASELFSLVRIQFIISVVIYIFMIILLPRFGFAGTVMRIYPCLAAGYFVLFVMYGEIIFLYYFNDLSGALLTAIVFCLVTLGGSIVSSHFSDMWYGAGLVAGAFVSFTVGYFRLRWVERHLDEHIFCNGTLFPVKRGKRPSSKVYDKRELEKKAKKRRKKKSELK